MFDHIWTIRSGQCIFPDRDAQTWWRFFWSGRGRKQIDSKHYVIRVDVTHTDLLRQFRTRKVIGPWFTSIQFWNKHWKGSWRQQEMGMLNWSWSKSETVLNVISYIELLLVSCDISAHGSRTNTPTERRCHWRAGVCLLCCFCAKHQDWLPRSEQKTPLNK